MASIQERPTKTGAATYRVGYRHEGKLRWTHTVETPEAAVYMKELFETKGVELALAIIASRVGRDTEHGAPLLSEMLERHLTAVATHATTGTVDGYRRMAARTWLPHLGEMPVDTITREQVAAWVTYQRTVETKRSIVARARARKRGEPEPAPRHYAPRSIQAAQSFLSDVLDAALEAGHVNRNVAAGLRMPSDHERGEMVLLSTGEFARLLGEFSERWRPLVAFLAGSGCRWGEATALYASDFDLDAPQPIVRISRAWKRGKSGTTFLGATKSTKGTRTVTLPRSLVAELRPVVEGTPAGMHVFRNGRGAAVLNTNFNRDQWKPAVARAGLGKRPRVHDLRHAHVSWLIAARVPLPVIQRRLGHESITTTVDTYGHLAPDAHWGAAEASEIALSGALPQLEAR